MSGLKEKLTKRVVDAAEPQAQRYAIHDAALAGFKLVVAPTGRKTFMVRYRVGGGRAATIREVAVGAYGVVTVDQAREQARGWLAEAAKGRDPAAERTEKRNAPRMDVLSERYLTEHARRHKKASSVAEDERLLKKYVLPKFARRKVAEITRAEVKDFHTGFADTPIMANRCLALLSKMFNLAEEWGIRQDGSNPCRHVKKFSEKARKRFLSPAELGRLGEALRRAESGELGAVNPRAIHAFRLLILTGLRSSEVKALRWDWIDFAAGRINLPDSKTGEKVVPLNAPALAVLDAIPKVAGNPHVIVGGKPGAALVNLKDPWAVIKKAADLDDVRIHDLRHSFAAVGAGSGASLHIIGGLLGHTQAQTTRRYAHLADDPLRAASEQIGGQIAGWLADAPVADVVPLRPSRGSG